MVQPRQRKIEQLYPMLMEDNFSLVNLGASVCVFYKCMFKEFVKSLTRPLIILYEMMILLMIYRTLYNNKLKNHITINIICGATCSTIKQVSKQVY